MSAAGFAADAPLYGTSGLTLKSDNLTSLSRQLTTAPDHLLKSTLLTRQRPDWSDPAGSKGSRKAVQARKPSTEIGGGVKYAKTENSLLLSSLASSLTENRLLSYLSSSFSKTSTGPQLLQSDLRLKQSHHGDVSQQLSQISVAPAVVSETDEKLHDAHASRGPRTANTTTESKPAKKSHDIKRRACDRKAASVGGGKSKSMKAVKKVKLTVPEQMDDDEVDDIHFEPPDYRLTHEDVRSDRVEIFMATEKEELAEYLLRPVVDVNSLKELFMPQQSLEGNQFSVEPVAMEERHVSIDVMDVSDFDDDDVHEVPPSPRPPSQPRPQPQNRHQDPGMDSPRLSLTGRKVRAKNRQNRRITNPADIDPPASQVDDLYPGSSWDAVENDVEIPRPQEPDPPQERPSSLPPKSPSPSPVDARTGLPMPPSHLVPLSSSSAVKKKKKRRERAALLAESSNSSVTQGYASPVQPSERTRSPSAGRSRGRSMPASHSDSFYEQPVEMTYEAQVPSTPRGRPASRGNRSDSSPANDAWVTRNSDEYSSTGNLAADQDPVSIVREGRAKHHQPVTAQRSISAESRHRQTAHQRSGAPSPVKPAAQLEPSGLGNDVDTLPRQRPPISPRRSVTTNRVPNNVPWARKSTPANGDIPHAAMHRNR